MDRPKLYLVSRNDGIRPNTVRTDAKTSQARIGNHSGNHLGNHSPDKPTRDTKPSHPARRTVTRVLEQRKPIWDDESSWDSI
jgi:hypothetical protein